MGVRLESLLAPLVRHVPDPETFVITGRQQKLPARVPGQSADPVVVSSKGEQTLPGPHVPDLDGFVAGAGCDEWTLVPRFVVRRRLGGFVYGGRCRVRSKGNALDNMIVLPELLFAIFGLLRPDPNGLVIGTRGDKLVTVHTDHPDPVPVSCVRLDAESGRNLPHLDRLVTTGAHNVVA